MIIESKFTVNAPRDEVAAYMLDPLKMLQCVPGVDGLEQVGDQTYSATLKVIVGKIRAAFQGKVTFDHSKGPDQITAKGDGRDRATGSIAKVTLVAYMTEPEPGVTEVSTRSDVAIRGRLGQFGTGVIQAIADEMMGEYAACVSAQVAGERTSPGSARGSMPGLLTISLQTVALAVAAGLVSFRWSGGEY